ncbi:phage tail protein [Veronia pacifica]|uniref:Phage tail protein n=1 Tax=Veronia pacifica TaxID=1080227 RepID=A0A1C3EE88_9GAMM|nr:phage tail protein [Veronia pacifica]ODA31530.1 hypothetical protein A8L45_16665 [Veronia pacifica]
MMLSLGLFVFEINTAAYQQLQHVFSQSWASNKRVGRRPAYQYLGPGEETITLNGTLYPEYTGGLFDLSMLREMASTGSAFALISGNGDTLGLWFIDQVSETQSVFLRNGSPRKIEFNLQLKRTDDNSVDQLGDLSPYVSTLLNQSLKATV